MWFNLGDIARQCLKNKTKIVGVRGGVMLGYSSVIEHLPITWIHSPGKHRCLTECLAVFENMSMLKFQTSRNKEVLPLLKKRITSQHWKLVGSGDALKTAGKVLWLLLHSVNLSSVGAGIKPKSGWNF